MGRTGETSASQQVNIKSVAQLAGVAASSVSRALNNHPDVSPAMRARVLNAVRQLGYQPDLIAQSLRRGATQTVGFVVRDITNPLFSEIVQGASQFLHDAGYAVLLTNSLGRPDFDAHHIAVLRQRRVDGMILSLQSETFPPTVEALQSVTTPMVVIDREVAGLQASAVLCDHNIGMTAAVEHLVELGHRHIALIVGPVDIRASRERAAAFQYTAASLNISGADAMVCAGDYTTAYGRSETERLLSSRMPTAIIAGSAQLGVGTLQAIRDAGLRIGPDLSVVVVDGTDLMELMSPSISVINRDAYQLGVVAAQLLAERLTDPEASSRIEMLPTCYIPRESSMPPGKPAAGNGGA